VAGGEAARHHPVIPLLSSPRGERREQGDERGFSKAQVRDVGSGERIRCIKLASRLMHSRSV